MAKISDLPTLDNPAGSEKVVVLRDDVTHQVEIGGLVVGALTEAGDGLGSDLIRRPNGTTVEEVLRQVTLPITEGVSGDVDATGIASRIIRPDGTQVFAAIETTGLNVNPFPLVDPSVRMATVDATGVAVQMAPERPGFPLVDPTVVFGRVDATGIASYLPAGGGGTEEAPASVTPIEWPYDFYVRLMKNQSLGNGYLAVPPRLTTPRYGSLMLSCGVRTTYVSDYSQLTLVPHVEAQVVDPVNDAPAGETSMRAAADRLNERIASVNGIGWEDHDFAVVSLVTGVSGSSIEGISPGTIYDDRARAALDRIFTLAQAEGKTAGLASIPWMIGEENTNLQTPVADIIALQELNRAGLDAYVKEHWGQTRDVQTISYQTSSHSAYGRSYPSAALAQWLASKANPNFHLACPVYWADCYDGAHIYPDDEDVIGAYMARVEAAVVLDGGSWTPLQPASIEVQGKIATAIFDVPAGPLVFDTDRVTDPGDYGLALYDPDGNRIVLDAPPVIAGKTVRFRAASMPAAVELRCGWLPGPVQPPQPPSGRLTGARCCLRDSAGDRDIYDPGGIARPLHNWCAISFVRSNAWPTN